MAKNPVGFQVTDTTAGWSGTDFDDLFIRKDCFLEGGLWAWGCNYAGSMGTNNTILRSSPVQTFSGGTNWRSVSYASGIKTDGTLWLWGTNSEGRLGADNVIPRSSPVQTLSGGTTWAQVLSDVTSTAAIKNDGTLWTWGRNTDGQLGNNTVTNRSSPVQTFSGGTNWKKLSAAKATINIAAIKTDGTLWVWGGNASGQLGIDNVASRSTPVQTISAGTNWKFVTTGACTIAGIKTDGTLWLWGKNDFGQLGNQLSVSVSTPVQTISGGTNWKTAALGNNHAAGIKTDGTLWLWGNNTFGAFGCGTNDTTNRSSPVQTVTGGTNWRIVSLSNTSSAAIKTDGTLWTWGYGVGGNLGNNSILHRSSPIQTVTGGTNWRQVCMQVRTAFAIREDCW